MTCEDVNSLAADYLGGELSPSLRSEVDAHLVDCAACRSELAGLATAAHALHATTVSPAEAERRVASLAVPASSPVSVGPSHRAAPPLARSRGAAAWWVAPLRYAAVIALAFTAGFVARGTLRPQTDRPLHSARVEGASPVAVNDALVRQFREVSSDFPRTSTFGRSLLALARRQG